MRHIAYRAKRKDTLATIAKRFNTTPQALAELNNLGRKARKLQGRLLTIPVQVAVAEAVPAAAKPVKVEPTTLKAEIVNKYYTVKKGDTLYALAKRFNVTARLLSAWNNLKTRVALKPGKRIIVAKLRDGKSAAGEGEG